MSFPNTNIRDSFINDLVPLISQSYSNCLNACPFGYTPQEPDFIAFLVRDLTNDIAKLLKKYFPNSACITQGVFCHQSPKVRFNNPNSGQKNCSELGDLLIIYKETINNTNSKNTAILLQAKNVSMIPHNIGQSEAHQLYLYEKWPQFEYVSPVELKGKKRNFPLINNSEGSQYLMYSNNNAITHTYTTSLPTNPLKCRFSLASAIGKMINFDNDSGRIYTPSISYIPNDDWSNTINDLIKIAKIRCFNRRKINFINQSRIYCLSFMNDNSLNDEIVLPLENSEEFNENNAEDYTGVSTLLIDMDINEEDLHPHIFSYDE